MKLSTYVSVLDILTTALSLWAMLCVTTYGGSCPTYIRVAVGLSFLSVCASGPALAEYARKLRTGDM